MTNVMIHNTNGNGDIEKASLSFVVANTALASGQDTAVLLTTDGVCIPTKGYTDGLEANGFPPLKELVNNFVSNGGKLWVCGACAKPRGIGPDDLMDGAELVGAATAVEAMVSGTRTISF